MFIKQITIEGVIDDVTIRHTESGAIVSANDINVEFDRDADREERFGIAYNVARIICGETKRGDPNATNSMIHDILREIERVAGC